MLIRRFGFCCMQPKVCSHYRSKRKFGQGDEMPKKANAALTIGDVAKISGVSIETIRYYERIGLLAKPARGSNGFRDYGSKQVDAIIFVSRSRKLGFPLGTIRELMRLAEGTGHCAKVRALTTAHRDNVRQQIDTLREMERALSALVDRCEADTQGQDCPIIDELVAKS